MSGDLSISLSLDVHSIESFGWTLRVSANEGYEPIVTERVPPAVAEALAELISPAVADRVRAANAAATRRVVELAGVAQASAERAARAAEIAASWSARPSPGGPET